MPRSESHHQDLALVQGVLAGQSDAQGKFCTRMRCIGRILANRNRRYGCPLNDHDLADLAQETAMAVWRRLDTYRGLASLETWVYRFCALNMTSAMRKRRRSPRPLSEIEFDVEPSVEPAGAADEAELDSMLRHLSEREAEVLRLRHVDGLGNQEICEVLEISINSVKTHSLHAMAKLRELFGSRLPKEAR